MCSIFVATPDFTKNEKLIFGKNSDREPNEAQGIIRIPSMERTDKTVECTYKTIPQVNYTHEILISRPFMKWGAEMGINRYGLVIGTNAVFSKLKPTHKNEGLIGSDLVRLALERCTSASQALSHIIELIEKYGQEGFSGYQNKKYFPYHSFLIADRQEVWLLETAAQHWVAKKVHGFYALANSYTIGEEFDMSSKDLIEFALKQRWLKKGKNFSFKDAFGDESYARTMKATYRLNFMKNFAHEHKKSFDIVHAMQLLSSTHIPEKSFNPSKSSAKSIAQYATGSFHWQQTNNSMVAEVSNNEIHTCWFTGTSSPKTSIFKPFFIPGANLYEGIFKEPGMLIDDSLWWQAEAFHREVFTNYQAARQTFEQERSMLQEKFLTETEKLLAQQHPAPEQLTKHSNDCLHIHLKKIKEWRYRLKKSKIPQRQFSPFYNHFIRKITKKVTPIV